MMRLSTPLGRSSFITLGLAVLAAAPAMAQTTQGSGSNATTPPPMTKAADTGAATGDNAPTGSLNKSHGDWRSSTLVGAAVYDDKGGSIGTVDDLLVSSDGKVNQAVLSVGGFLGLGTKLVAVPLANLKQVPSKANPASGSKMSNSETAPVGQPVNASGAAGSGTTPGQGTSMAMTSPGTKPNDATKPTMPMMGAGANDEQYSLVLPGATMDSLKADAEFKYAN